MRLRGALTRRRHVDAGAVFLTGLLAASHTALMWLTGADGGAMKILLASLLFCLASLVAYVSDPDGGRVSARRGYIVGGLSLPLCAAWIVRESFLQRRGFPYPGDLARRSYSPSTSSCPSSSGLAWGRWPE